MFLLVKWKGYERKSDMTWEPEENCEYGFPLRLTFLSFLSLTYFLLVSRGAKEILQQYYTSIGGRPTFESSPALKGKRSRTSLGSTPAASKAVKRAKTSTPAATNKNGNESPPADGDAWNPPKGSWEDEITCIDTIEKTEKGLVCYVQW